MKYTGPKVRLSRRVGVPMTRKASKCMERKPGAPGVHRSRFGRKLSDYGRQLLEKQRLRFQYNITDRALRNYYIKAAGRKGNTAEILVQLLESRLDALVLRAGFGSTIYAARQLVGHGHLQVNGRRVDIPSYQVRPGDTISVRQKSRTIEAIKNSLQDAETVPYLAVDKDKMSAVYTRLPEIDEVPVVCEAGVVVEFYAK